MRSREEKGETNLKISKRKIIVEKISDNVECRSLVRDLATAQFVVALSKSHLPTA